MKRKEKLYTTSDGQTMRSADNYFLKKKTKSLRKKYIRNKYVHVISEINISKNISRKKYIRMKCLCWVNNNTKRKGLKDARTTVVDRKFNYTNIENENEQKTEEEE